MDNINFPKLPFVGRVIDPSESHLRENRTQHQQLTFSGKSKTITVRNPEQAKIEPSSTYQQMSEQGPLNLSILQRFVYRFLPFLTPHPLQRPDINSLHSLSKLVRESIDPRSGWLPCCGNFDPTRFLHVMHSLCESSYENVFPKTIISVGSGRGFLEKCFGLMGRFSVKCYDREPCNEFIPVEQAEFPKDIEKILPDDCRGCLLLAGFPHGYLGPVLVEFIRRGGKMLCTTVEGSLFDQMHEGYEDNPDVLYEGIKELRKKNGEFFQIELAEQSKYGPLSYIQFYNWPLSAKQAMLNDHLLMRLCSDIEFSD